MSFKSIKLSGAVLLLVSTWGVLPEPSFAQLQCYDCHGTRTGGGDSRPLDSSVRNYATGGFAGNHRTHMGRGVNATSCAKCHPGSGSFTTEHRDGRIRISPNINASSLPAVYRNVTSVPQTSTPTLGSCTNVNCHFEQITPAWGSTDLFQRTSDCNGTCHGAPPLGGSGGANGSHSVHDAVYPGVNNCTKCHPDHLVAPEFAHATSAANRGPVVKPSDPVWGRFGEYTASRLDFLPSQNNRFSVCSNFYCHSTVQGLTDPTQPPQSIRAPAWGGSFSDYICGGKNCHGVGWAHPDDASKPANAGRWQDLQSGNHAKHLKYRFNEVGNCVACHYNFSGGWGGCSDCHGAHNMGYVDHVQHEIHMEFDPYITVGGLYSGDSVPGTAYGRCSALYCHSDGTYVVSKILNHYTSIAWGAAPLGCDGCHGNPPAYPSGSPKPNSHPAHGGTVCSRCHYATTTDGATISTSRYHVNKSYNVNPQTTAGVSFTYQDYSSAGSRCSNISCHRGNAATWGGTLECSSCHGTQNLACDACHDSPPPTASHLKHFAGTATQAVYGATTIAEDVSPDSSIYLMNCGNCHPLEHTKHGNGIVEVELHHSSSPRGSLKFRNPVSAAYSNGTTVHFDSRGFSYTSGTCSNVYCHSYTEWATNGPVPVPSGPDLPTNLVTTRRYRAVMWGGAPLGCTGCHANPPSSSAETNDGGAGNSHSWIDEYGYDNLHNWNHGYKPISCTFCHNGTVKELNTWQFTPDIFTLSPVPIASHAKHVNGKNDVQFDSARYFNYSTNSLGVVSMDLRPITYDQATRTCSNVACHMPVNNACGGDSPVKWGVPYRWYTNECEKCHEYGSGCP